MNKAKYVEKMTDLVEETLQRKGVSETFTIYDNYDEDGELSMTLAYDHSDREETYQLGELYRVKKESDVKVKDQYRDNFKERVEAFVERELQLRSERLAEMGRDEDEDLDDEYEDDDYEDDFEDDDDLEEDDYEDDEETEEAEIEPAREVRTPERNLEQTEHSDEEQPAVSPAVANFFKPLNFVDIADGGSAKAAVLPPSMQGKSTSEVAKRYQNQIKGLFADGAIVAHPNASDVVVFDMAVYEATEVLEMLPEMSDEDGDLQISEVENDEEHELQ